MPLFDIILRTMIIQDQGTSGHVVSGYALGATTLIFFCGLIFYIVRVFMVCVPADSIPWCCPISQVLYLNILIKIILVLCVTIDS